MRVVDRWLGITRIQNVGVKNKICMAMAFVVYKMAAKFRYIGILHEMQIFCKIIYHALYVVLELNKNFRII